MYHFMKNRVCVASKKSVKNFILIANSEKRDTILPADEQSIADSSLFWNWRKVRTAWDSIPANDRAEQSDD